VTAGTVSKKEFTIPFTTEINLHKQMILGPEMKRDTVLLLINYPRLQQKIEIAPL
jgi:hypothetical protein